MCCWRGRNSPAVVCTAPCYTAQHADERLQAIWRAQLGTDGRWTAASRGQVPSHGPVLTRANDLARNQWGGGLTGGGTIARGIGSGGGCGAG